VMQTDDVDRLLQQWAADELAAGDLVSSGALDGQPDANLLRLLATRPPDMTEEEARRVFARVQSGLRAAPGRTGFHLLRWAAVAASTLLVLGLYSFYRHPLSSPPTQHPAPQVLVKSVFFHTAHDGRVVTFRLSLYKSQEPAHAPSSPALTSP
jgi:hypothetical protein